MGEKTRYRTRQREELIRYLRTTGGSHFTAADVCRHFREAGSPIGTATVYRQLEDLTDRGQIKKYVLTENGSACFQYVDPENCCGPSCYHLKCEKCGRLIHMECREIEALEAHIFSHHGFRVDPVRTVFYGVCSQCQE